MTKIIVGSQSDIAAKNNQSLAQTFLNAEMVVLLDTSSSMEARDARNGQSRIDAATDQLTKLQGQYPGKIALICFASFVNFKPDGKPDKASGMTDLAEALKFTKVADDCGLKIVVISDGEPSNEQSALDEARKYKTKIDAIFIGREGSEGEAFLRRLVAATGGKMFVSESPGLLEDGVEKLLLGAG